MDKNVKTIFQEVKIKKAEPKDPAFKNCFSKIKSEVLEKDYPTYPCI